MGSKATTRRSPEGAGGAPVVSEARLGAYLAAVEPPFQALRSIAGQLGGVLLSRAAGLQASVAVAPALAAAETTYAEALDRFLDIRVPPEAAHRHAHLARAFDGIGAALAHLAGSSGRHGDAAASALARLRHGWAELQKACAFGPGLSTVDFGQCCAHSLQIRSNIICVPGERS